MTQLGSPCNPVVVGPITGPTARNRSGQWLYNRVIHGHLKVLMLRAQSKSKAPRLPGWGSVEHTYLAGTSPRTQSPAPTIHQSAHKCPNREPECVSSPPDDSNGPPRWRAVVLAEGNFGFPPPSSSERILSSTQIRFLISPGVGSQTFPLSYMNIHLEASLAFKPTQETICQNILKL